MFLLLSGCFLLCSETCFAGNVSTTSHYIVCNGSREIFQQYKAQGSARVSFWNTGEGTDLNTFPSKCEGASNIACVARALAFSAHIQDAELAEMLVPITFQRGDGSWWT